MNSTIKYIKTTRRFSVLTLHCRSELDSKYTMKHRVKELYYKIYTYSMLVSGSNFALSF